MLTFRAIRIQTGAGAVNLACVYLFCLVLETGSVLALLAIRAKLYIMDWVRGEAEVLGTKVKQQHVVLMYNPIVRCWKLHHINRQQRSVIVSSLYSPIPGFPNPHLLLVSEQETFTTIHSAIWGCNSLRLFQTLTLYQMMLILRFFWVSVETFNFISFEKSGLRGLETESWSHNGS